MSASGALGILLQKDVSGTPTTIAGLRSKSLEINNQPVDVTTSDSTGRWQELLAGVAIKSLKITGSGVSQGDSLTKALVADCIAGSIDACTIVAPGIGTFAGNFAVPSFKITGEHTNAVMFEIGLESSGAITFTPAA